MKIIYFLIISILFIFPCCKRSSLQSQGNGIVLKAVIKGSYNLPQNGNFFLTSGDSIFYFLVDIKLINKTNSSFEFITYSCSAFGNVVVETTDINVCANHCAKNVTEIIKLMPNQEFSLPVILQVKKEANIINSKIRIGFLLLNPKGIEFTEIAETFDKCRNDLKNIIWSSPFILYLAYGQPYEIK